MRKMRDGYRPEGSPSRIPPTRRKQKAERMSERTFRILASCQEDHCREEVSYHMDMLRWWNDEPICENCFDELAYPDRLKTGDDGNADLIQWNELPPLTVKEARP